MSMSLKVDGVNDADAWHDRCMARVATTGGQARERLKG